MPINIQTVLATQPYVYHLIVLLAIVGGLFVVAGQWQRVRLASPTLAHPVRLQTIALASAAVLRLGQAFLPALAEPQTVSASLWALPAERVADAVSLALLAWAFVPVLHRRTWPGVVWLAANSLLGLLYLGLTAIGDSALFLPAAQYNLAPTACMWGVWQVLIATVAVVGLLLPSHAGADDAVPPGEVETGSLALVAFLAFLIGDGLHLLATTTSVLPGYSPPNNIATWVRLGQVVGYPVLAIAVYGSVIAAITSPGRMFADSKRTSPSHMTGLVNLLELARKVSHVLDVQGAAEQAAAGILHVTNADQCGIALLDEERAGQLRLVAVHQIAVPNEHRNPLTFSATAYAPVERALRSMGQVVLDETDEDTRSLTRLLGCTGSGPVLIQPLGQHQAALGVLMLANGTSHVLFDRPDRDLAATLGGHLTVALGNARAYQALQAKVQQLTKTLRDQESRSRQQRAALEVALKKSQEEVALLAQKLYEQERAATRSRQRLEDAAHSRLMSMQDAVEKSRAERDALQEKIRDLQREGLAADRSSETILEDLNCGVIIADANGNVSRINSIATQMLGLASASVLNQPLIQVSRDERWRRAVAELGMKPYSMAATTVEADSRVLRATLSSMAAARNDQREVGTVAILYDITSDAESQQARDQFVASLSQELRTPMTSIIGYTDLLLGESVGVLVDMQRKFLQRIKANIERLNTLLNDLISVSVIDAGQLELHRTPVDMGEILEDTIVDTRAQLEDKEITLELKLMDRTPVVEADADRLRQILANLVGNAAKCSPVGSTVQVSTAIHHENEGGGSEGTRYLKVSVRDCGGGIAPGDLERVFERFYRADRAPINGLGETGVGLAIVKALVEAHGGRVWVESDMGVGSTFIFLLPVTEAYDDPWLEMDVPPLDFGSERHE
jgi:PAS domain S-box-containing protein